MAGGVGVTGYGGVCGERGKGGQNSGSWLFPVREMNFVFAEEHTQGEARHGAGEPQAGADAESRAGQIA